MHFCENKNILFAGFISFFVFILLLLGYSFPFYPLVLFSILSASGHKNGNEELLVHGFISHEPFFEMHIAATGRLLFEQDMET